MLGAACTIALNAEGEGFLLPLKTAFSEYKFLMEGKNKTVRGTAESVGRPKLSFKQKTRKLKNYIWTKRHTVLPVLKLIEMKETKSSAGVQAENRRLIAKSVAFMRRVDWSSTQQITGVPSATEHSR